MRKLMRAAAALTFTVGAVLATGASAQAGTAGAQATYAGCREGYVCIYPNASWNNNTPEHDYYTYGAHNLVDEYGVHRIFNNQTGGATVQLCTGYNGVNCGTPIAPWSYRDVDLTPYNSIRLAP